MILSMATFRATAIVQIGRCENCAQIPATKMLSNAPRNSAKRMRMADLRTALG
jgi:hypothetical protein